MSSYILSIVVIILVCGFVGCGIGALLGGASLASTYTGYGAGVGLVLGLAYFFTTHKSGK